jgi:hypothetical protein
MPDFTIGDGSEADAIWQALTQSSSDSTVVPRDESFNVTELLLERAAAPTVCVKGAPPGGWHSLLEPGFPTVESIAFDIAYCGILAAGQATFWSYGAKQSQVVAYADTLTPPGTTLPSSMEPAWWEALNNDAEYQIKCPVREPVFIRRVSQAFARAAANTVHVVIPTSVKGGDPYQVPPVVTDPHKDNVWYNYELPELQKNANMKELIAANNVPPYNPKTVWKTGQATQTLKGKNADDLPVLPCNATESDVPASSPKGNTQTKTQTQTQSKSQPTSVPVTPPNGSPSGENENGNPNTGTVPCTSAGDGEFDPLDPFEDPIEVGVKKTRQCVRKRGGKEKDVRGIAGRIVLEG